MVKPSASVNAPTITSEEKVPLPHYSSDFGQVLEHALDLSVEVYNSACDARTIQKRLHMGVTTEVSRVGTMAMTICLDSPMPTA